MTLDLPAAHMRGDLPAAPAGAAALYKTAELAGCPAHSLLALAGASPGAVSTRVLGQPDADARSPLAISRGVVFERSLRRPDRQGTAAARLRTALAPHAPAAASGTLLDIDAGVAPGPAAPEDRDALTADAVNRRAAGDRQAPAIVWQPSLLVRFAGATFRVRPDLLVAGPEGAYEVAEIKSWPDNGPRTDQGALRSALGQAAVGVLALAQATAAHRAPPPERAALVLAAPRRATPRLRVHGIARELSVLAAAAPVVAANAAIAASRVPPGARLDSPGTVRALPTRYSALCASRCALARWCRERAVAAGDPAALGAAAAALAPAGLPDAARAAHGHPDPGRPPAPSLTALIDAGRAYRTALASAPEEMRRG